MQKIDIHVHAATKRIDVPFGNPMDPESHYICDTAEMTETLSEQGISSAILMSSGESPRPGVHSLGAYNADCAQMAKDSHGFFSWMCGIDPISLDTVESRLAEYKSQGAVGVGEVMVNQWLDSPYLHTLLSAAEKLQMPVLCHMSPREGFSYGVADHAGLPLLEKVLREHPDLIYIGHSQVFWLEISSDCPREGDEARNGFGRGPVIPGGTVERLMDRYPNLYCDLSAFSGSCAIMRDEAYGLNFLEKYQDRLMFGTDSTNRRTVFPLNDFLDRHYQKGTLSTQAYEKICCRNARRIFKLQQGG